MNPVPLHVRIAGVGAFLPALRVSSAELEARLGLPAGWVEHVTGVRERRYAVTETTVEMGAEAARRALIDAGRVASDVDLIVAAMSAPAQAVPCTAAFLQRAIGAPGGGSACFDVNATCLSFIAAIQTVAPLIASGVYRTALVVSSELPSRSLDAAEPDCAVLFGDAAAAVVLERNSAGDASTIWHTALATWSEGADLTEFQGAGTLHHPNDPTTTREMNTFRGEPPGTEDLADGGVHLVAHPLEATGEVGGAEATVGVLASEGVRLGRTPSLARPGLRVQALAPAYSTTSASSTMLICGGPCTPAFIIASFRLASERNACADPASGNSMRTTMSTVSDPATRCTEALVAPWARRAVSCWS